MTDELLAKIERLEAQVAALTNDRLPKVDRASKRRDRRQVLGGFGMFAVALLMAGTLSASALSGTNTVSSDDIIDGQVYNPDIHDRAVTGAKVLNDSLTGADINESTLALACPTAAPTRVLGLCVGDIRARDTQEDALIDCADEGLRLPSVSEGTLLSLRLGGSGWTDHVYWDGTALRGVTNQSADGFATTFELSSDPDPYRCITTVGARP